MIRYMIRYMICYIILYEKVNKPSNVSDCTLPPNVPNLIVPLPMKFEQIALVSCYNSYLLSNAPVELICHGQSDFRGSKFSTIEDLKCVKAGKVAPIARNGIDTVLFLIRAGILYNIGNDKNCAPLQHL